MKAVVTGATGFLGAHLACRLLSEGHEVLCLKRKDNFTLFNQIASFYGYSNADFDWEKINLQDIDSLLYAFTGKDVVFHCAALISFRGRDKSELYETNVLGTQNVCNACLRVSGISLIFASSVAAIGRKPDQSEITENSEWVDSKLNSHYGISKHLAELEVWRSHAEGLNAAVVNPGIILGTGDGKSGSNAIFNLILKGLPVFPIGINGFVGVDDVCKAMILAYEQRLFGHRFLLVAENISYRKLLAEVALLLNTPPPKFPIKGAVLTALIFIARLCDFFRIPFPYPAQGLISTSSKNNYQPANIIKINGFSFQPVSLILRKSCKELYPEKFL